MSGYRTHASVPPTGSSRTVHARLSASSDLRRRADRYRRLAQTLLTPDVIAVVLNCARDLEVEARATAGDA